MFEKIVLGVMFGTVFLVMYSVISLIAAIPTYFLWNWLMPNIFGIKAITFLQAWGINFLTSILFKSSSSSKNED